MIVPRPGQEAPYEIAVNNLSAAVPIPAGFNPLGVAPAMLPGQLLAFNLPAEPDPATQPDVHAFWTELFSPPLAFVGGMINYEPAPAAAPLPKGRQRTMPSPARQQSSNNWSGASLLARDGRMFTDVMARFVVPNASVPAGGNPLDEYRSSCWVGLDGQRFYPDATLPQIGTEQSINKRNGPAGPACIAWFQWWPMNVMLIPQAILPVAFGDTVYCWITALTPTRVRAVIKIVNPARTVGNLMRIVADAPPIEFTYPPTVDEGPRISGATAEWVTEAPTSIVTQKVFPLPDYGAVTYEKCIALSALAPGQLYRSEPLFGPTLMHIYTVTNDRRRTISRTQRPAGTPGLDTVVTTYG